MEIVEDNDKRLVINSFTGGTVVFDRDLHRITKNNKLIARFEKIKVIDLRVYSNNDHRTQWGVSLHFGFLRNFVVGESDHQIVAAEVAAKISKVTDKNVVSWA